LNGLRDEEKRMLLNASRSIHSYKLVQIKGYRTLASKTEDKKIKQLLTRFSNEEEKFAELWSERIRELGSEPNRGAKARLEDLKVKLLMSILGTKGFFEWVVLGEEEGIQDLSIQAERIKEDYASETWSRFASDERMHLERVKTEVLGMESWEIRGGGGVRDMIFGANDGLVSTLAFVAGVSGAITDPYIILLSGVAELFAGTISMAAGSYQSSKSELEVLERESQRKKVEKGKSPEEETEELTRFYQREGFSRGEAEAIVLRITDKKDLFMQTSTLEELGLAPEELGSPVKAGVLCGASFGLAAIVPLLPFVFPTLSCTDALTISIIATLIALFGVGAMKTIFSRKNWIRSGLEMMVIGASAAAITYLIGTLFSIIA
jgi:predicted membrane protein (TIGR00267 family)